MQQPQQRQRTTAARNKSVTVTASSSDVSANRANTGATAVAVALPGMLASVPAPVLASVSGVSPRGGEGTGQPLGADSPLFLVVILGVFATVWAFFFVGALAACLKTNTSSYGSFYSRRQPFFVFDF